MRESVFLSFEKENWMWLLRHNPNFLCDLILLANRFSMHHHEQEIVQIFTNLKLTNLTLFSSKLYQNFWTSCEVVFQI